MSKSLPASKQVMQHYLSELLTEEPSVSDEISHDKLEKLLQQVNPVSRSTNVSTPKSRLIEDYPTIEQEKIAANVDTTEEKLTTAKSSQPLKILIEKEYRKGSFQALFFKVAGLTVAVPLIELGGIHNVGKITSLMGKPPWYKGVMLHRDENINVVDTAMWVMPEKYDNTLAENINYQYIIMLGESSWGMLAESLVDTVTLTQEDVKWLDAPTKRPWLAGLVKERKCALLDVQSMIQLLSEGANINSK